ncbi:MAG: hypothetical protein ACI9SY_000628 [Candidatus Paceibacteria bacterium]|jgi:hypothetical protein
MLKIFIPIFFGLLVSGLLMFTFLSLTPAVNLSAEQTMETIGKNYPKSTTDLAAFEMYWERHIKKVGAKNAYDTFKDHYSDLDTGEKHEVAHYFGGVLYDSVGLEGISVCDDDFSYGCFHELITFSIMDHGTGILTELNDFCTNSEFDCQHGIGHGILADFGYTGENLSDAIDLCHRLGSVDESDGCFGGIFMEYNLRTIWGKDAPLRAFDDNTKDTTCEEVSTHGVWACYFWSAQWYMALSQNNGRAKQIEWTLGLCNQFSTEPGRLQCINGLGYEIGSYESDPIKAIFMCNQGNSQLSELHHQQCVISTLAGLNGDPVNREAVRDACFQQDVVPTAICTTVLDSQDNKRIGLITNY